MDRIILHLNTILDAIDEALALVPELDETLSDHERQRVNDALIELGTSIEELPVDFRIQHRNTDWQGFIVLKDFLINNSESVSDSVRYNALGTYIPQLREDISKLSLFH